MIDRFNGSVATTTTLFERKSFVARPVRPAQRSEGSKRCPAPITQIKFGEAVHRTLSKEWMGGFTWFSRYYPNRRGRRSLVYSELRGLGSPSRPWRRVVFCESGAVRAFCEWEQTRSRAKRAEEKFCQEILPCKSHLPPNAYSKSSTKCVQRLSSKKSDGPLLLRYSKVCTRDVTYARAVHTRAGGGVQFFP